VSDGMSDYVVPPGRHVYPPTRAPQRPISTALFNADGRPVYVTMLCPKCRKVKPLRAFGLRRLAGRLRSISQCKRCRGSTR
jgi:hypothetical protein